MDGIIGAIITFVGIMDNLVSCLIFSQCESEFNACTLLILIYQSRTDLAASLIGFIQSITFFVTSRTTGCVVFDLFVCHVWHSYYLYWYLVSVSAHNTTLLSVNWYINICRTHKHTCLKPAHIKLGMVMSHMLCLSAGALLCWEVRLMGGCCIFQTGQLPNNILKVWVTYGFMVCYAIPCIVMLAMYTKTIYYLKIRQSHTSLDISVSIIRRRRHLSWAALAICIVYIFGVGFAVL